MYILGRHIITHEKCLGKKVKSIEKLEKMVPDLPSWLNNEFTQRILRLVELDATINVIDILTKAATHKCDNYLSDMIRVVVDFTREQNGKKIEDRKSLIFKFEPIAEGMRQDMARGTSVFETEIAMMSKPLKKINNLLGSRLSADIFYIRLERPLCLIMEDLAPQGFRMADRQVGLDLAHSMLAIQGLAKFHASSVAFCEEEPRYKSILSRGLINETQPKVVGQYWADATMHLASEIEEWPELGKRYAEKLRNLAPKLYRKGLELSKYNEDEFNVINHGDCWVNNMLFRYDKNSKPVEHVFVDFQLSVYNSPAIDLHYFLSTSLSEEVSLNNIIDLYKKYLQTLGTVMQQLGCKTLPPTMEELQRSLKERMLYSLIASIGILPLLKVDKDKAQDFDEMISENGFVPHPGIKHPSYRKIMSSRIPEYVKMGLLDK